MLGRVKQKILRIIKNIYVNSHRQYCSIDVRELFVSQNRPTDFQRYDIVVRYMFIEQYFEKNIVGYGLYEKMQKARAGKEYDPACIERYKKLILSIQKNGYEDNSKITVGADLQLIDGSHRIATCLYFNHPEISICYTPIRTEYDYSMEWFIAHDFTDEEMALIKQKYNELESKCNQPFQCIMWPSMASNFDAATGDLKKMENVLGFKDYSFTKQQFEFFIKGVYAVDDIDGWKVEKKIENMVVPTEDIYKVRILDLKMTRPNFRLKQKNYKTLSRRGEQLKLVIRTKYKDKIPHYFYDNVMHISDNYAQNAHIRSLKDFNLDITEFFKAINNEKYVIAKLETPYMPKDFPENVPVGKDIDILCMTESLEHLADQAETFCHNYASEYNCIRRSMGKQRFQIRLELNGFTLFLWDFTSQEDGLNDRFVMDAIADCIIFGYIHKMKPEYEVIYRRNILNMKSKQYHEAWVREHIGYLNIAKENSYQICMKQNEKLRQ